MKSESQGKTLETPEMITHYGTRTLWRVHGVRKWQMFTAGSTGVGKVSQPFKQLRVSQPFKAAQPGWDTGMQTWQCGFTWAGMGMCSGDPEGENTEPALSAQFRAKAHFELFSQRLCQCCSPNSSHSSPAFTQVKTSSVGSQYLSISTRNSCIWPFHSNALSESPVWTSPWEPPLDPWFQQIFPINGIHGSPESAGCE